MPKRGRGKEGAPPTPDTKSKEVVIRLEEMEVEVDRRCEAIKAGSEAMIERLRSAFMTHLIRFPKAVRNMSADQFFGLVVEDVAAATATAKPPKPAGRPRGGLPPASARPPRAAGRKPPAAAQALPTALPADTGSKFSTPGAAARTKSVTTPGGSLFQTPSAKMVMTGYVSRIKQLEAALTAMREKYGEEGGEEELAACTS